MLYVQVNVKSLGFTTLLYVLQNYLNDKKLNLNNMFKGRGVTHFLLQVDLI